MQPLAKAMADAAAAVSVCSICGNVDTQNPCTICRDPARDPSVLVVVEDVGDLWALERASGNSRTLSCPRWCAFSARRDRP